jgi:hypothetical protein
MIFDLHLRGRCSSLLVLTMASFLTMQAADAANNTPTNCNAALTPPGFGGAYFTNAGNTTSPASAVAGTTISGSEASTSLATELLAQRRIQEAQSCPVGYIKVGGLCQPENKIKKQEVRLSRPRRAPSDEPPVQRLQPRQTQEASSPSLNAVWGQAFTDYEQRTGLGTALAPASRTQRTDGLLFGTDRVIQSGDGQIVLGILGSLSDTKQDFRSSSSGSQPTTYTIDLSKIAFAGYPNDPSSIYDYVDSTNHLLQNQETQTLRGGGLGLTASLSRGGYFSDGLFKADFLNLSRASSFLDTFNSQLDVAAFEQFGFGHNGCINTVDQFGNPLPIPTTSHPQTVVKTLAQSSTAMNLVLADSAGYHFDLNAGYWVEPLAGFQYTFASYGSNASSLGLEDGHALRLQGGARVGLTRPSEYGMWTTSFTGLLYSDVYIHGFVTNADGISASYLLADQGKLRVQGIFNSRLQLSNGVSAFLECQARGGSDYWALGARVGGRYEF